MDKAEDTSLHGDIARLRRRVASLEGQLRGAEEGAALARFVDSLPDAVVISCDDRIVYANPAAAALHGAATPQELVGKRRFDTIHPDYRDLTARRAQAMTENGVASPLHRQKRLRLDGAVVDVETAAVPCTWQGRPAIMAVNHDIGDRLRREEEIAAKHALLETALENMSDGLWVYDADMRLLAWNRRVFDLLGLPMEMAHAGASFVDFIKMAIARGDFGDADPEGILSQRIAAVTQGHDHVLERGAPGGKVLELRHCTIPGGGWVTTYTDITERNAADQEMAHLSARLLDFTEALKRSNDDLEQFAYVASHDLQEPLRMVSSFCQLLQRRYQGKLDKDADEFIDFAVDGARRMQERVNDLLLFSRVTMGRQTIEAAKCDEILAAAVANLQITIADTGAEITADPLPEVPGDRKQLIQLFQALLANSLAYGSDEPPVVHVGVRPGDGGWQFSVSDNGIGIPPADAERVFKAFHRGGVDEQGSGLGLAICKRIVNRHGGRIWVGSNSGRGSTLNFTLAAAGDADDRP